MSNPNNYTVGWICAIDTEYVAAQAFLDEKHEGAAYVSPHDNNDYTLGKLGGHNVVIAVLPDGQYGTSSAAIVARDMLHSFPNVRIGLLVGIGGGAPSPKHDIRLGDIVVSAPRDGKGGVLQYDFGKTIQDQRFRPTGFLNQPPMVLRTAVNGLKAQYEHEGHQLEEAINSILEKKLRLRKKYKRPDPSSDRLYRSGLTHPLDDEANCAVACGDDPSNLIFRHARTEGEDNPAIHYGLIASANQLMKDASARDRLAAEKDVLCFEMEAAGLMNHFPCLVVRGICDYSDSHKRKQWQGYAAMVAAAYAKDLLYRIPQSRVEAEERIGNILSDFQERLIDVSRDVDKLLCGKHDQEHQAILDWISAPDPLANYQKAVQLCQADTGIWFLESEEYASWKIYPASFLWLHGIPGCGKTVLSSTVIRSVQQHCANDPGKVVAYFYFDFNDPQKQVVEFMIRSLIVQLSEQCIKTPSALDALYLSCGDGRQQPSLEGLLDALQREVEELPQCFIILDALDECTGAGTDTGKEELLRVLQTMVGWQFENLHLLVTSRREREIEDVLGGFVEEHNIIGLRSEMVDKDINIYVRQRLRDDKKLRKWHRDVKMGQEIEATLMEGARGMFRWAVCQLDMLSKCLNRAMLRKALAELPPTLDETYERILHAIEKDYSIYVLRILRWLAFSARPLLMEEIVEVAAIDPGGDPMFDKEELFQDSMDVTRICSSLVSVVNEQSTSESTRQVITLAHYSVKEYLISDRIQQGQAALYSLKSTTSHGLIAESCLGYLLQFQDSDSFCEETIETYALAEYSAEFWMTHVQSSEQKGEVLNSLIRELYLSQDGAYLNWLRIHNPHNRWPTGKATDVQRTVEDVAYPLYSASEAGLTELVKHLITKTGANVNEQGGEYGNALQVASAGGHSEIVELLLQKDAKVNAQGGFYGTALQAASAGGHDRVVELLLSRGAEVNSRGGWYGNAIKAASAHGHNKTIEQLLSKGAEVNARGGIFGNELGSIFANALHAASSGGYDKTVELLLENGAEVNVQERDGGSPLEAASSGGYCRIVELVLSKGAEVNAQGGDYGTALQAASAGGHDKIVELLLSKGAEVNAQGGYYGTPLQAASAGGHDKIAELLFSKGAEVNAQGGWYGTALQAASAGGHDKIIKLLLREGAEVNTQGREYKNEHQTTGGYDPFLTKWARFNVQFGVFGTALQAASAEGHSRTIELLLDQGANVNGQGGVFGTALQAASARGHDKIVELLLSKGTEVNMQSGYFGTALQAASAGGHDKIIELLFGNDAKVNMQGGWYGNSLLAATAEGHHKTIELLLSEGAEVNAQNNASLAESAEGHGISMKELISFNHRAHKQVFSTALQAASAVGYDKIVELLLSQGAEVNWQGGVFGTALQAASLGGNEKIVELLLNKGAEVNIQGGKYGAALQAASSEGHDKVVELLLSKGADINIQGGWYGTALQAASAGGYDKIVELLLSQGAEVNWQGGVFGTALQAASAKGYSKTTELFHSINDMGTVTSEASARSYIRIVKQLVNKGAKVNEQGGVFGNALQAASAEGCDKIIKLLLDKGAEVNATGGYYGNALQAASVGGYRKIVKLLLDKGAEVNAPGGEYGNALQAASVRGNNKTVDLLLSHGVKVNAQGGYYGTALQAASSGGYDKTAELLLSNGAEVNAPGGEYGNALQAASSRGYNNTVEFLLSKGAEVNAQGGYYGTALQAASSEGYDKTAELLLSKGAEMNVQGGYYGTALQAASAGGHDKIVELLLSKGAEVNAQGGYYGTPLQAASAGGHDKIAELLLSKGAGVNSQGGQYSSALQAALAGSCDDIAEVQLGKNAEFNGMTMVRTRGFRKIIRLLGGTGAESE